MEFDRYAWDTWFESMTLPELKTLSAQWFRAIQRLHDFETGHELQVMRWNQQQLNRAILTRQGAELIHVTEPVTAAKVKQNTATIDGRRENGEIFFTCKNCGHEFQPKITHLLAMICPSCYKDFRLRPDEQHLRK